MKKNAKNPVLKLAQMAMLAAISIVSLYVVPLISFFPSAPYLQYDMADVPVLIGTMMFGPFSGLVLLAVVCVIQGLTISAQSGWVGIVMHFLASGTLVLVAGGLFKLINGRWTKESSTEFKRTAMQIVGLFTWVFLYVALNTNHLVLIGFVIAEVLLIIAVLTKKNHGLVIGLVLGTLAMAAAMVPLNLFFTVRFFGVPYQAVRDMLLPVIVPFNLIKAGLNSLITALVFLPLKSILLKKGAPCNRP